MGISTPGQTLGLVPAFSGRRTITYNYDFANGDPAFAVVPSEFLFAPGSGWSFNDGGDGEEVGIFKFDASLTGGAQAPSLSPRFQLGVFDSVAWETRFFFSGFAGAGGGNQAFTIGMGIDSDGCAPLTLLGFVAASNAVSTCGVSYGTNNVLHAYGADGVFGAGNFFGNTPIANVTGIWTTLGFTWTAADATVRYLLNGAPFGAPNTTRIPLTSNLDMWFFGWSGSTVLAPIQTFRFDYVSATFTLTR